MLVPSDLPPQQLTPVDRNPPTVIRQAEEQGLKLPPLPDRAIETDAKDKDVTKQKIDKGELQVTYDGKVFCNGEVSAERLQKAVSGAFDMICKYDQALAKNLTRNDVSIVFIEEGKEVLAFIPIDPKFKMTDRERAELWLAAIPDAKEIGKKFSKEDFFAKLPLRFDLPNGADGVTVSQALPRGDDQVVSVGSVVVISDRGIKEMPEEFKKDPQLREAYIDAIVLTQLSHEGYHLGQLDNSPQGTVMPYEEFDRAGNIRIKEMDAYPRQLKILKRILLREQSEPMQRALKVIIEKDSGLLEEVMLRRINRLGFIFKPNPELDDESSRLLEYIA